MYKECLFCCSVIALTDRPSVQVYLQQLGDTGGSHLWPPAVIRILNSKACRTAIMFGDPLLPTECAELIAALKLTQLCFSCAHGRPTMAPLVNIAVFERHLAQFNHKQASQSLSVLPANRGDRFKDRLMRLVASKDGDCC